MSVEANIFLSSGLNLICLILLDFLVSSQFGVDPASRRSRLDAATPLLPAAHAIRWKSASFTQSICSMIFCDIEYEENGIRKGQDFL